MKWSNLRSIRSDLDSRPTDSPAVTEFGNGVGNATLSGSSQCP